MSEKSSRGRNLTEVRFYVHKYLLERLFGEVGGCWWTAFNGFDGF